MIPGSSLDALAARWANRPEPGVFAALAEGLAKRGDLDAAARVVTAGLARYPGHAAGLIARARIALATGDRALASRALAELLERDPDHPLALEMAGADVARPAMPAEAAVERPDDGGHQPTPPDTAGSSPEVSPEGNLAEAEDPTAALSAAPIGPPAADLGSVGTDGDPDGVDMEELDPDGDDDSAFDPEGAVGEAPVIITESLAALYHQQGHLEEAMAAYAELAARDPANDTAAARHEAIRRELATHRPLPFDARQSGGRAVAEWLATLAVARPGDARPPAAFDAFYEAPPAPADATADFDAFQRWLEELAR